MTAYRPFGTFPSVSQVPNKKMVKRDSRSLRRILIAAIILLFFTTVIIQANANSLRAGAASEEQLIYVVGSGDTLWLIAKQFTDESGDIRKFVHQMMKVNGLKGSTIHPGQQLLIPGL